MEIDEAIDGGRGREREEKGRIDFFSSGGEVGHCCVPVQRFLFG